MTKLNVYIPDSIMLVLSVITLTLTRLIVEVSQAGEWRYVLALHDHITNKHMIMAFTILNSKCDRNCLDFAYLDEHLYRSFLRPEDLF